MAGSIGRFDVDRQQAIRDARRAIARGQRPAYHATWAWDGTGAEIEIVELPGVWTIAPTVADVPSTSRHRIAVELGVPESAFDVLVSATPGRS
jgi:hypothetical protein